MVLKQRGTGATSRLRPFIVPTAVLTDLRALYVRPPATGGIGPNVMKEVEAKETLVYLSGKYGDGMIEPLKVGTVSIKDLGEVRGVLATMGTRSNDHIVVLPWNHDTICLPQL